LAPAGEAGIHTIAATASTEINVLFMNSSPIVLIHPGSNGLFFPLVVMVSSGVGRDRDKVTKPNALGSLL
jgi:hypothetical protein